MKVYKVVRLACDWDEYCGMAVVANDPDHAIQLVKQYISDEYVRDFIRSSYNLRYVKVLDEHNRLTEEAAALFESGPKTFKRERRDRAVADFDAEHVSVVEIDLTTEGIFLTDFMRG